MSESRDPRLSLGAVPDMLEYLHSSSGTDMDDTKAVQSVEASMSEFLNCLAFAAALWEQGRYVHPQRWGT